MSYEEAMAQDPEGWQKAVDEEFERMTKQHHVFEPVEIKYLNAKATIIDSTWVMKLKSDGTKRARMAARGFKQISGKDFDPYGLMSPVVNIITVFIVLTLIIMFGWYAILIDLKRAFLTADMEPGREIYMKIPKGLEKYYPKGFLLKLLKCVYGCKQSSHEF